MNPQQSKNGRIAIFGGRFDPPHIAHIIHAELILDEFQLEKIIFIPAANPPHKKACAEFEDRFRMLKLAIAKQQGFELSDVESKNSLSYTVDTLKTISPQLNASQLYLIIGNDEYNVFSTWREPEKIRNLAELIVLPRLKHNIPTKQAGVHFPDLPHIEISSTLIRSRIASKKSVRFWVPESVEKFIYENGLYKEVQ